MNDTYRGAALQLSGLTKRYGATHALKDFDLGVDSGEFVSLLGPSGSGKSTILNLISGYQRPDSGTVQIEGSNVASLPPAERDIGIVFQQYALFPHMSVFDNVAYGLKRRKWTRDRIKTRVGDMLDLVGLEKMGSRRPAQLSGGQQQRVALARALAFEPRILLMDEPLAALDREIRVQLRGEIRRIHRELRPTIIYVTHDRDEAFALSDRVVIMRNGRAERVGTPTGIYDDPRTAFVSTFYCGFQMLDGIKVQESADQGVAVHWCGQAGVVPAPSKPTGAFGVAVSPADFKVTLGGPAIVTDIVIMGGTALMRVLMAPGGAHVAVEIGAREAHSFTIGSSVGVEPDWSRAFVVEHVLEGAPLDHSDQVPSPL